MDHYDICPLQKARDTISGLCLLCVKQGKISSNPRSFCAKGGQLSDEVLKLRPAKERRMDSFSFTPYKTSTTDP